MTIEKITVEDTKELLEIYAPYVKNTAVSFEYEVPTEEEFAKRLQQFAAKYPCLKAVEDGKILGYAYAHSFIARRAYDWSVETTIYVRQDCKRRGVGRALYEILEKSLKDMGVLNMNACIASPTKEDAHLTDDSYNFHSKMGFSLVGRFHNSGYKFNTWYDMIWMEKLIGVHDGNVSDVRFGEWDI